MTGGWISSDNWDRLVAANYRAVQLGWAEPGVLATAVGPTYVPGHGILYVGKSAGPLGARVGSGLQQIDSGAASTHWMLGRFNRSAFWQLIDRIDPPRRSVAWTNVCKMDRRGGEKPPSAGEWNTVRSVCIDALEDEIRGLRPKVVLFAVSDFARSDVGHLLHRLEYQPVLDELQDGWTEVLSTRHGVAAILTKHPQGWGRSAIDAVAALTQELLDS